MEFLIASLRSQQSCLSEVLSLATGYEDDNKLLEGKNLEGCCHEVFGRLHLERRRENSQSGR